VSASPGEVTQILLDLSKGDREAQDRWVPLIHGVLRRISRTHLPQETTNRSLQSTALVHEAYLDETLLSASTRSPNIIALNHELDA
jgi:hypothetical protein